MKCFKFNIDLAWLNTLGGWEHFRFTAFKTHGYNIGNTQTIKRDIFQDWDTDFIAGATQSEHISLAANERITVRSQDLTKEQVNAAIRLQFAIKVIDETDPDNIVTVLVSKGSVDYRTDNDKRHEIAFSITYPDIIIQTL